MPAKPKAVEKAQPKKPARSKKPVARQKSKPKPKKKAVTPKPIIVDMKARFPPAADIMTKLLEAKVMTNGKSKGKVAEQNGILTDFVLLLASRPSGARHINRLVVDWTRVVETRLGVGSPLPKTKEGKPLFQVVLAAILPSEVTASAVAAYHALYGR
jgi:hypothetical protein